MNQNSIDHVTIEIKDDQLPTNDVSFNIAKTTELGAGTKIFRQLGSSILTFLGSFCEMTAVASILRKKLALEMQTTADAVPVWFFILYLCLGYQTIETIIWYSYLKETNQPSQKMACLFEITHQIALMLSLFIINLRYEGVIGECFMFLAPFVFLLEAGVCWGNYSNSRSLNIVTRLFCILQSSLLAAKMNNLIDLEWSTTLVFVWIYLGINAVYMIFAGLFLILVSLSSLLNFDRGDLSLVKNEAIGYIWHISYNAFNVVGIVLWIGYFGETDDFLEAGLDLAQKLSLFLGIYTVLLFPILKNQSLDRFQDLLTNLQVQDSPDVGPGQKKYTLLKTQNQSKKEFFLMISSTYFSLLKAERVKRMMQKNKCNDMVSLDISADENVDISQEQKEDNLCYICETSEPNTIIAECGHGGVCYDCVVKSIRRKNECMECRKPVKTIYKIESESKNEAEIIVEACEFVQVIET